MCLHIISGAFVISSLFNLQGTRSFRMFSARFARFRFVRVIRGTMDTIARTSWFVNTFFSIFPDLYISTNANRVKVWFSMYKEQEPHSRGAAPVSPPSSAGEKPILHDLSLIHPGKCRKAGIAGQADCCTKTPHRLLHVGKRGPANASGDCLDQGQVQSSTAAVKKQMQCLPELSMILVSRKSFHS